MSNNVQILGRLTKDPDVHYTTTGKVVANFTVAVQDTYKKERADFIPVVVWNKVAEACGNNLVKGQMVFVDGKWKNRSFTDKSGTNRQISECIAKAVAFLGKPKSAASEKMVAGTETAKTATSSKKAVDKPPFAKK